MGMFEWFAPVKFTKTPTTYKFSSRAKIVTLWLMVSAVVFFIFYCAHLLPVLIWAAVAAYLFNPLISLFSEKTKIPRALSIIILYVILGLLMFWSVKSLIPLISNEISDLSSGSIEQSSSFIGRIAAHGNVDLLGISINFTDLAHRLSSWAVMQFPSHAAPIFFGAVEKLILLIVFFVVTFYFLLESGKYREAFERIIPEPYREEVSHLIEKVNMTLGAYIRAQILLILIMSCASFIVLSMLKIQYAGVLSIMTGVLEVIPVVGPICATAIVAIVAIFQIATPFGISKALLVILVIAAYFILRQMEDYFVIPNVAARFVKVHPVIGIASLLVGGSMGGVLGLFLAIPTAAILKVLFSYLYHKLVE